MLVLLSADATDAVTDTAVDPATGWALVGYIVAVIAMVGLLALITWSLYRIGLWFVMFWWHDRFEVDDQPDDQPTGSETRSLD